MATRKIPAPRSATPKPSTTGSGTAKPIEPLPAPIIGGIGDSERQRLMPSGSTERQGG